MITLKRTDSSNQHFVKLVKELDKYLAVTDGNDHAFYDQYNKIDKLKNVIVAYEDGLAVACGAIKEFSPGTVEVKRMFTSPERRGKGIAKMVLTGLEQWAVEL